MTTYSPITGLVIALTGVTDGNGRVSVSVDNTTGQYQRIHWNARVTAGSTAPSAGTLYEVYGFREDLNTPTGYVTDGLTLNDTALTASPENAQLIGTIVVDATAFKSFYGEGTWEDPGVGKWAIGVMNETAAIIGTTGLEVDNWVHWAGEKA